MAPRQESTGDHHGGAACCRPPGSPGNECTGSASSNGSSMQSGGPGRRQRVPTGPVHAHALGRKPPSRGGGRVKVWRLQAPDRAPRCLFAPSVEKNRFSAGGFWPLPGRLLLPCVLAGAGHLPQGHSGNLTQFNEINGVASRLRYSWKVRSTHAFHNHAIFDTNQQSKVSANG